MKPNFLQLKKLNKIIKEDKDTNTTYKRPFLLEKIAKDIHCEYLISSLKNKFEDPLIKQNFLSKEIPKKITKKKSADDIYSIKKISFHKLKNDQNKKKMCQNLRKCGTILPLIPKTGSINRKHSAEKIFENENITSSIINSKETERLVTSGMFKDEYIRENNNSKIKIRSFINKLPGKESLENYKKIEDIKKVNEKYNLNLKLKQYNLKKNFVKKLTIFGMLNKLYQKYSRITPDKLINNSNIPEITSIKQSEHNKDSNDNSFDYSKEFIEDNSNTFLTKIHIEKKNKGNENDLIKKIINRHMNSVDNFSKSNIYAINKDNKIFINCLLSKVNNQISRKKILYKYIDRTIYKLEDDPVYRRIKNSEPDLIKLLKRDD